MNGWIRENRPAIADPVDGVALQILRNQIECIAHDTVTALYTRLLKDFDDDFRDFLAHSAEW